MAKSHNAPIDSKRLKDKNPSKKSRIIDKIVQDFAERLLSGEPITIQEVLRQHPKLQDKLKPELEAELSLVLYFKAEHKKMQAQKELLEQKLEKMILAKAQKRLKARLRLLKTKSILPIKFRMEFIPILLYLKGRTHRIAEGIRGITRFIKLLFLLDKETNLGKLVKPFYEFVPYKIGPFEPALYQDLKVLEMAGVIKTQAYTYNKLSGSEAKIDEGFNRNGVSLVYTLTDTGMKYAQALINWLNKKDPEITLTLRKYKTYYAQAPLKKLLAYIYEKYPEYTTESEIIQKVLKE